MMSHYLFFFGALIEASYFGGSSRVLLQSALLEPCLRGVGSPGPSPVMDLGRTEKGRPHLVLQRTVFVELRLI